MRDEVIVTREEYVDHLRELQRESYDETRELLIQTLIHPEKTTRETGKTTRDWQNDMGEWHRVRDQRCSNCRFYVSQQCRRRAAGVGWPRTDSMDWCGEWETRNDDKLSRAEVLEQLRLMHGNTDDQEANHIAADKLLMRYVDDEVARAFDDVPKYY